MCGQQIDVVYPCLYHQMADRIMIYYAPGKDGMEKAAAAFETGADVFGKKTGTEPVTAGYTNRVVGSLYDFQEKLAIFDAGLDDRVVEICKVLVGSELQDSQPEAVFDDLLFYRDPEGGSRLALMREGNAFASIGLSSDIYHDVGESYRHIIDTYGNETVIDMDWVMRSVSKAGGE